MGNSSSNSSAESPKSSSSFPSFLRKRPLHYFTTPQFSKFFVRDESVDDEDEPPAKRSKPNEDVEKPLTAPVKGAGKPNDDDDHNKSDAWGGDNNEPEPSIKDDAVKEKSADKGDNAVGISGTEDISNDDEKKPASSATTVAAKKRNRPQLKTASARRYASAKPFLKKEEDKEMALNSIDGENSKGNDKDDDPSSEAGGEDEKSPVNNEDGDKALNADNDPFFELRAYTGGKMPNNKVLRQWVKSYVICVDVDKKTTNDAVETASMKFGVEMKSKKSLIKKYLAEEVGLPTRPPSKRTPRSPRKISPPKK